MGGERETFEVSADEVGTLDWDGVTFPAPDGVVVAKPIIVQAVGTSVGKSVPGDLGYQMEAIMVIAVERAQADGASDDEVKARKLETLEAFKQVLSDAHQAALDEGVQDADEIAERQASAAKVFKDSL